MNKKQRLETQAALQLCERAKVELDSSIVSLKTALADDKMEEAQVVADHPAPTGWRFLRHDEIIRDGDQFSLEWLDGDRTIMQWQRCYGYIGSEAAAITYGVVIRPTLPLPHHFELIPIEDMVQNALRPDDMYAYSSVTTWTRLDEESNGWVGKKVTVNRGNAVMFARRKPAAMLASNDWRRLNEGEKIKHGDWFKTGPDDQRWSQAVDSVGTLAGSTNKHPEWTYIREANQSIIDPNK